MPRYASDVVVIGAGIAGVAAAIDLLDRGRQVVLFDRDHAMAGIDRPVAAGAYRRPPPHIKLSGSVPAAWRSAMQS